MTYVEWFSDYQRDLAPRLGRKCASLGEMTLAGLPVPPRFAITADGHRTVCAGIEDQVKEVLAAVDPNDSAALAQASADLRALVESCPVPDDIRDAVTGAYLELSRRCGCDDLPVAVRSSATCEDSPDASFAGEHDTYLWVCGCDDVLAAVRRCSSSLFTERAIAYRRRMGLAEDAVAMSVAVQKMVRPTAGVDVDLFRPDDELKKLAHLAVEVDLDALFDRTGDDLARPIEQVRAERDRIVSEYSELLATDEDRATFEEKIGLARWCSPTWRTTTSTSSTERTRWCGARCASSAGCW